MNNNKPTFFAILPASVRYAKISDFAKILYAEISAMTNIKGYCYATNIYFADLFGKSEDTIKRAVAKLRSQNFIDTQYIPKAKGTERRIYLKDIKISSLNITPGKNAPTGQKCTPPPGKNAPLINTSINITTKEEKPVEYLNDHQRLTTIIKNYCNQNPDQLKYFKDVAAFPGDLLAEAVKFAEYYLKVEHNGFIFNPVKFFKNGFISWLKKAKRYNTPKNNNKPVRAKFSTKNGNFDTLKDYFMACYPHWFNKNGSFVTQLIESKFDKWASKWNDGEYDQQYKSDKLNKFALFNIIHGPEQIGSGATSIRSKKFEAETLHNLAFKTDSEIIKLYRMWAKKHYPELIKN